MPKLINIIRKGFNHLVDAAKILINPAPAMADGASSVVDHIKLGFRDSRDPWGRPWKPLKVRKGKPLIDTGKLRSSFYYTVDNRQSVTFRSSDNPAKVALHQNGGFTTFNGRKVFVPARPFLPIRGGRLDIPPNWLDGMNKSIAKRIRAEI